MALSPEEIARRIERLGTDLPDTLSEAIQRAADIAIEEVKSRMNFETNSPGGVRASIRAEVSDDLTLGIFMPPHGWFQNYGVVSYEGKGINKNQERVPKEVKGILPPSGGDYFQFGVNGASEKAWGAFYTGLNAKDFLKIDPFLQRVADIVNENLEL